MVGGIPLTNIAKNFFHACCASSCLSSKPYEAAAKEAYRVARDLYQVGRATTTDLIEAESELVTASLKEIDAALNYRVARVKLAHATGKRTL